MPLDPDAQKILDLVRQSGSPPYDQLTPEEARRLYRDGRRVLAPDPLPVADLRDLSAPGPHGPIPVRSYRPAGAAPAEMLPALVYFHGGGWVFGDIDTHDGICRHLANASGCAIVSVDYRMAPEHRFPVAVDEAFAATRWVADSAAALGIDGTRLAVGGDSAGGNLAAVVSLLARDAGGPAIRFQMLFYPATDFTMKHSSHERFAEGYLLTRGSMHWFHGHYLRGPEDKADWRASPLDAAKLDGLPPAYVLTAGYDPLSDEGEAYARRLVEAGVRVTSRRYPGQIHGFLNMGRIIRAAGTALDEAGAALRAAMV